VRILRAVAWTALLLDFVVLAQLGFGMLTQRTGPETDPSLRGLTVMLGSGLLGVVILLVVSSRLHSRAGLWIALGCAALPLLWTVDATFESMWQ
jgi:hypothetical protein